jgi:hypothetical protein
MAMRKRIAGIAIPDSEMARAAGAAARAIEPDILYRHSLRVFLFAALIGVRRRLVFNAELLYVAALFHDMGLTTLYRDSQMRFELDGANAVRAFLGGYGMPEDAVADVWNAIALHTTFGICSHMSTSTGLIAAGVETDLLGMHFDEVSRTERNAVLAEYPRGTGFKAQIIDVFAQAMAHRPATTFGTVNADVLERCDPNYRRMNFCGLILGSDWKE